jgi:hypothetical protein
MIVIVGAVLFLYGLYCYFAQLRRNNHNQQQHDNLDLENDRYYD